MNVPTGRRGSFKPARERRMARDEREPGQLGEIGDQVFGDPVREVLLILVGAGVAEGQHRERGLVFGRIGLFGRVGSRPGVSGGVDAEQSDLRRVRTLRDIDAHRLAATLAAVVLL